MRKVREIFRLSMECGVKSREIGRSCSISHTVVNNYLKRAKELGLTFDEIEQMSDEELKNKLSKIDTASSDTQAVLDWEFVNQELKKKSVTMELLWQEYLDLYPGGYSRSQYYKLYAHWKKRLNVSLRQSHKAGEKLFVDYAGQTVPVIDRQTGEEKASQIFVAVLGASNYTYAEATRSQSIPDWIDSHINAFEYFGGVPEIVVPDNLKSGVTKSCRYEPDINSTYHEMARHYDIAIIPARVRKPKDKAKAEVGVQIVERWILAALRNRQFFSLVELNEAITELLDKMNNRPFKKLSGSRLSWFEEIEKGELRALPESRYELSYWKKATVNIDYHIELERHYYSVPYHLVHEKVELKYTEKTVEILYKGKRIACHRRSHEEGRHSTITEHMPKSHQKHLEWTPTRMVQWAARIGNDCSTVITSIMESRKHPEQGYRSCLGILRLSKRYGNDRLEAACKRAVSIRGMSYKSILSILEKGLDKQAIEKEQKTEKAIHHANIRGGTYYH